MHQKSIYENGKIYLVIQSDYQTEWRYKGLLHRESDKPAFISSKLLAWFKNGKKHREDGPAIISHSYDSWHRNGKLHREDGPAIIYKNNVYIEILGKYKWYLNDVLYLKKQFLAQQKDKIIDLNGVLYLKDGRKIHGL